MPSVCTLPISANTNHVDAAISNAQTLTDFSVGKSFVAPPICLNYLLLGESYVICLLTEEAAILAYHVREVVGVGSQEEMTRVPATPVVALVAHKHPIRYWPSEVLVAKSMAQPPIGGFTTIVVAAVDHKP